MGILALSGSAKRYQTTLENQRNMLLEANDGRGGVRVANVYFLRYLLERDEADIVRRDSALNSARRSIELLRTTAADPDLKEVAQNALTELEGWRTATDRVIAASRAGNATLADQINREVVQPARAQLDAAGDRAIELARRQTEQDVQESKSSADTARNTMIGALLVAIILGILFSWLLNRSVSAPLQSTSRVLASSAAEILAATTQQAAGATETVAAVTETAATLDEVVQTAEQAAERAKVVAETSRRAAELGVQGSQAVEDSIAAMEKVRTQVELIAQRILVLAEQAQAVGEINTTITDLAEQTNLLALN